MKSCDEPKQEFNSARFISGSSLLSARQEGASSSPLVSKDADAKENAAFQALNRVASADAAMAGSDKISKKRRPIMIEGSLFAATSAGN